MTSFLFILAYVTLSTRIIPSLYLLVPFQAPSHSPFPLLSLSLSLSLSFIFLDPFAFPLRLASAILLPPALLAALTPSRALFVGTRRMGTRDALLQIQMGTYANGVTCYYTFPYTNNVLIGPHTLRAPRTGGRAPLFLSPAPRQVRRGYPIRARHGNRFIDRLFAASLPPDRSTKLECANPGWGSFSCELTFLSIIFLKRIVREISLCESTSEFELLQ